MTEPRWVSIGDTIALNEIYVAATGETHFVRDEGLLEAAVMRPRNYFAYGEEDVLVLSAVLLLGICQNHPFEQGNKRTGFGAFLMFLQMNGLTVDPSLDHEKLGQDVKRFIVGHPDPRELRDWVAQLLL